MKGLGLILRKKIVFSCLSNEENISIYTGSHSAHDSSQQDLNVFNQTVMSAIMTDFLVGWAINDQSTR